MGEIKLTKNRILEMIKNQELLPQAGLRLLQDVADEDDDRIAVIGIAGQFPDAHNADQFWENLKQGKDSVTEVPESRWKLDEFYNPDPNVPNKSYSKWCGLLDNIDEFDPLFFNISPREADFMDPQQRLFLMEAWKALEDAGYTRNRLEGKKMRSICRLRRVRLLICA
ncbi:MAG TPA: polyketide synthase [Ruminiclostridium sp.]|nr:polyketide synthase [Ruminiclostridium sp.]